MGHSYLDGLFTLEGRRALVTGGSSGIGRAVAQALCAAGAEVVVTGRDTERLGGTVHALRAEGGTAAWLAADLSGRQGAHRLADAYTQQYGHPHILVNSAGVNIRPPLGELSEADWDHTLDVNLHAPFVLGQRFGPAMAEDGWGRVIHIASQQAVRAFGDSGACGVSKAALTALTRSQAEAWSRHGVCVNAIAPGFVDTPLNEAVFRDPVRTEAMARRTMAGRNGGLSDFAGAAVFLAGDACAYVTGQTLFVDGGFSVT
ncbi:SDR family NAD(P)-dependent oxidoreductase [Streptomyces albidoflavus]|uniref:SDR family NAD(P)-dependent oxidoreductase n=1 Tax=Streptomyces albidoflavus TaxID=1886 RepID=UPI0033C074DA